MYTDLCANNMTEYCIVCVRENKQINMMNLITTLISLSLTIKLFTLLKLYDLLLTKY